MTYLLTMLFLLLACVAQGAGLGPYNPAQHSVNGFMPTQVPDLQLWLDGSKLSWMTNGQSVAVWRDWSGKSNAATNGTASKQPTITTINGRTAVVTDGTDDWLAVSSFQTFTRLSIFIALKQENTAKSFFVEHGPDVNSNDGFFFYGTANSAWACKRTSVHSAVGNNAWSGTTANIVYHVYNSDPFYVKNGVIQGNQGITGGVLTNSVVTNTLNIASRNGTSVYSHARWAEVIMFTNALSTSQQLAVSRYLGTKYGIVVK